MTCSRVCEHMLCGSYCHLHASDGPAIQTMVLRQYARAIKSSFVRVGQGCLGLLCFEWTCFAWFMNMSCNAVVCTPYVVATAVGTERRHAGDWPIVEVIGGLNWTRSRTQASHASR
jgi:hypothetical protein